MAKAEKNAVEEQQVETLLEYLKEARGFDFSGYKRSSLQRRIQKRLEAHDLDSYSDYQDLLEVTPSEFTELFDTVLINVTAFFRDRPAWDYLAEEVIPQILESKSDADPIRVWSAACSSGEESYTAAMLLAEALGEDEFRRRVKIYATDIDEDALTTARHAVFDEQSVKPIPEHLLEKYFEPNTNGYAFRGDIRRAVIFGRNDLVQDAPISHIDLLISRNALMYFTRDTQSLILTHFNFALEDHGFLFLGKSEMLLTHTDLFVPHNLKWRVFQRVPTHGMRERLAVMGDGALAGPPHMDNDLRSGAADTVPVAQVILDRNGFVVLINEQARALFKLGPADVGRPFQDLSISYRPVDLRSALESAYTELRPQAMGEVQWLADGGNRTLAPTVIPIVSHSGIPKGASITFQDVTELTKLNDEHDRSKRQLETAYEELQSTVEELETTNEELQSTNEELETTNEELQSTNEELETMNEELQSTNEELEAMNDEQRSRARELDRLNMFLEGILGNLGVGVVVLDSDQVVQIWNAASHELWGIRAGEAEGHSFFSLDIGLPLEELRDAVQAALGDPPKSAEIELEALNRRGRSFTCHVRTLPLGGPDGQSHGAILLMTDHDTGS
jgi:two-component system, chemotaxis family, CheB/CheR fusion protein